ncbi:MAG: pyridoxal phosphate-dependent aminotransferase family protein [Bacteroidales bacterium]|nr:pyridoxal phosphate-dependent aminotransferase family protein [Bacteroidales bacterium]
MTSHRQHHIMEGRTGTEVILNGLKYLYFAGTSYFQLHTHPDVVNAAMDATHKYGVGSATTRVMTGTTPLLLKIEDKLAGYFNTEDAVYLPSGYLSSLAGLKALDEMGTYDVIFLDEGSHYSLVEGAIATGRPVIPFRNRDPKDLELKISEHLGSGQRPLVATDGLFPVIAKLAPVRDYLDLAVKHQGVIWIDDAHGVGILGAHGRGTCEALGARSDRIYLGATLSKAFGAYGGIIMGSGSFINKVRSGSVMTGSSSPMNAAVAAAIKGLELVQENPGLRKKLWKNARYLNESLGQLGITSESRFIPEMHGTIPVASFSYGDAANMKSIHNYLMEQGIYIQYTKYKGAGPGGVLRIVVSSSHKKVEIVRLTTALKEAFRLFNS